MLYIKYGKNLLHGFKMSFENIDADGQTADVWLYYKLTLVLSAQVS